LNDQEWAELIDKISKKAIKKIDEIFNKICDDIEVIDVEATVEGDCE
jgi:hypothetical protein